MVFVLAMTMHESFSITSPSALSSRLPTDRRFGWVMGGVFLAMGIAPRLKSHPIRGWALVLAAALWLAAWLFPARLRPLNRLWMRLGERLGRITEPVLMTLLFFLVITPLGWLMRVLGKRPLQLERDAASSSYWIAAKPASEPYSQTLRRQF